MAENAAAENKADELSEEEKAAILLAMAVYTSILESTLPQDAMEALGKSIVAETPWSKLPAKQRLALFRVANILHDKLPRREIAPTSTAETTGAVLDSAPSEEK